MCIERRFVTVYLLSGYHGVETYLQLRRGVGEQVVVNIGEHGQLVAGLQTAQCGDCIGKGLPVADRFRQAVGLGGADGEVQLASEVANHLCQHLAIATVEPALGARLQFRIEIENLGVAERVALALQQRTQVAEQTGFPVNQCAVAVEGQPFKACEIYQNDDFPVPATGVTLCEANLRSSSSSAGCAAALSGWASTFWTTAGSGEVFPLPATAADFRASASRDADSPFSRNFLVFSSGRASDGL